MTACSSHLSEKPPSLTMSDAIDTLEDQVCRKENEIDSFYLKLCQWPTVDSVRTPQDTLYTVEDIMNKYRECFIRHNGLVGELVK